MRFGAYLTTSVVGSPLLKEYQTHLASSRTSGGSSRPLLSTSISRNFRSAGGMFSSGSSDQ